MLAGPRQAQLRISTIGLALWLMSSYLSAAEKSPTNCEHADYQPENALVYVAGGEFEMGSDAFYPEERDAHRVIIDEFWISRFEVSNLEFLAFVTSTNYKTVAERYLDQEHYPDLPPEQREPGSVVFLKPRLQQDRMGNWWHFIQGANWRHPEGPNSNIEGRMRHPVVHIAYEDALAYATWKGHELPTEAQWEYAARTADNNNVRMQPTEANTWQGLFPMINLKDDGFEHRAPVGCFEANEQGLHDMIGNVWEWTSDRYFPAHNYSDKQKTPEGFDPTQPGIAVQAIKGGSFLCAPNFCQRYRPTARHAQDSTLGTSHIGFRTVLNRDAKESTRK